MTLTLPLQGVRVLALEQFGAGPYATLNLGDMGAEVIKIEDPSTGGDVSRSVPPGRIEGDSFYFQSWNRNKRSIALNLRQPEGMRVFQELVGTADVVFNNLRGDQPAKLGLTYDRLGSINRRIVCCSLNGFGAEGPRAGDPGYDYLMQAYTGYMSMTGDPCGPPAACGVSFIDHAGGLAAALGIVSALYIAQKSGKGADVEISLLDTAYSMLTYLAIWNMNLGLEPVRRAGSAHQSLVPVQTFRTADGYITIFCGKEKFWRLLCETLADPVLIEDSRFATFDTRAKNRDALIPLIQAHFARRSTSEWLSLLKGRVPCAPVQTLTQALSDSELVLRGTVVEVAHPIFGKLREVNTPVRFSQPRRDHQRGPSLGEHTESILRNDLRYSDEQIERLRCAEAIGR